MSDYQDQNGNRVTFEQLLDQVSESILANLIAFDLAGIPRSSVQQVIGSEGGLLVGGGAMFETPVSRKLSTDQGKQLLEAYGRPLKSYDLGQIAPTFVNDLMLRNNTAKKAEMIRNALKKP